MNQPQPVKYLIQAGLTSPCLDTGRNANRSAARRNLLNNSARLLGCAVLCLTLAACSSVKTRIDKGPVTARTFSFLDTGSRPIPGYAEERKEAHAMVQQALIQNLAKRGVSYVPSGGDITVAYLVVVGNNGATTSLNSYFGYSDDSEAILEKVHAEQTDQNSSRAYLESGTLVVDLVDPKSSKLLQRRSIRAQVLRNLTTQDRTTRVQTIVDQALQDLPLKAAR